MESPEFHAARIFLIEKLPPLMEDAGFRKKMTEGYLSELQQVATVGNFFENLGVFVKKGIIDREIARDLRSRVVLDCWNSMTPAVFVCRRMDPIVWENFEYLAALMRDWEERHRAGTYPPTVRRMENADKWRDLDATGSPQ